MLLGLRGLLGLLGGELICDYNEFLLFGEANSFNFYSGIPNYVLNNFNLLFFMSSICILTWLFILFKYQMMYFRPIIIFSSAEWWLWCESGKYWSKSIILTENFRWSKASYIMRSDAESKEPALKHYNDNTIYFIISTQF